MIHKIISTQTAKFCEIVVAVIVQHNSKQVVFQPILIRKQGILTVAKSKNRAHAMMSTYFSVQFMSQNYLAFYWLIKSNLIVWLLSFEIAAKYKYRTSLSSITKVFQSSS